MNIRLISAILLTNFFLLACQGESDKSDASGTVSGENQDSQPKNKVPVEAPEKLPNDSDIVPSWLDSQWVPPVSLKKFGFFVPTKPLTHGKQVYDYQVNLPLWSDGLEKVRWVFVPNDETVAFKSESPWSFPRGSVLMKHFVDPGTNRFLESRLYVHRNQGWQALVYIWNEHQTDAALISEAKTIELADGKTWLVPGPEDCARCHRSENPVLGITSKQMISFDGIPNEFMDELSARQQLTGYKNSENLQGFPALDHQSASLEDKARAMLHVNCSSCHDGSFSFDLSWQVASDSLIGAPPQFGSLGVEEPALIKAGSVDSSMIWLRMNLTDGRRMPAFGTSRPDSAGLAVLKDWIESLRVSDDTPPEDDDTPPEDDSTDGSEDCGGTDIFGACLERIISDSSS
ncbi:hypothetical protein [Pseudobacteriovorax antillogorgiicola]|uniref:Uncharacterized protein n=1 Tax=Pseudobacteriovorax antillogorgiicola TaxID=1513793 RepID=A0A1Y6C3J8_9BACT|nr:hypothetical protein [Pseudobacteriovorax antillogorgiicola]TCS49862.1 hypothetical protein EDD56_114107 [Pseudobacteriovorax antillogorgiicola]SMF43799.1 hypothetical protein SAMN06296036_113106 [Pseudobacteriovorax antillogorgiicola]